MEVERGGHAFALPAWAACDAARPAQRSADPSRTGRSSDDDDQLCLEVGTHAWPANLFGYSRRAICRVVSLWPGVGGPYKQGACISRNRVVLCILELSGRSR